MPPFTTPRADARRHQQLPQRQRSRAPWLSGWNRQCLAALNLDVAWARFVKAVGRRLESPNRPVKSGYYAGCYGCLAGVALVCALLVVLPLILQRRAFLSPSALRAATSVDREALAVAVERHGPYIDSADISAAAAWPSALDDLPPARDASARESDARARGEGGAGGEGVTGGKGEGETREERRGLQGGEQQGEGERRSGWDAEGGAEAACASGGAGCPYPDIVVRAKGPLHARMEAVCAGYAITQLLAMKLSPPVVDAVGVPHPHSPHAAATGATGAAGMDAAAAAGSSGGSSSSSGGVEGPGVGEEGVRQLRLAVLWQPDSGVWDAHFHHLFQPLPLSPSLPDDHDTPHNGSHNDPRAAGAATVAVLHERPLWLHSPLYAEGRLDLDIVPAPSQSPPRQQPPQQPQQQPQPQPQPQPGQPQPQHNPHHAQQAPWLVEQPPVPFPTQPHTTRRRLLGTGANRVGTGTGTGRARSSQHLSSGCLASARLLFSPHGSSPSEDEPGTQSSGGQSSGGESTEGQSTGRRRRLAEVAGGNTGSTGSSSGGSSGGGGGNTVSVSLHLLSSLRSAATSMEVCRHQAMRRANGCHPFVLDVSLPRPLSLIVSARCMLSLPHCSLCLTTTSARCMLSLPHCSLCLTTTSARCMLSLPHCSLCLTVPPLPLPGAGLRGGDGAAGVHGGVLRHAAPVARCAAHG
ncbi:unnamed protein product [Closterium sp. NIES-54]